MTRRTTGFVLAGLIVAALTLPARASDPIGMYCLVERVVMEPADCPERVQIWGACSVANLRTGGYDTAKRGYFDYAVPKGQEDLARSEWMDLKRVAGKMEAVGFGGRRMPQARLRPAGEKPGTPDPYPLNVGVVRLHEVGITRGLLDDLKAALGGR